MKKYKFGVLGAGNMGTAISEGAVRAGRFAPEQVLMFNRSEEKRAAHAAKGYAVTGDYTEVYAESEIVLLAVKPQNFDEILPNLAKYEGEKPCRIHCRRRNLRQAGGCTRRRHRDDPRDAEHTAYARRGCNPAG
jgi:glycerol-3-phosphate dehydrogenase